MRMTSGLPTLWQDLLPQYLRLSLQRLPFTGLKEAANSEPFQMSLKSRVMLSDLFSSFPLKWHSRAVGIK